MTLTRKDFGATVLATLVGQERRCDTRRRRLDRAQRTDTRLKGGEDRAD